MPLKAVNEPAQPAAADDKSLVMGVINVTPDSFYDGGRFDTPSAALQQARGMLKDGAAWLDVGGESSRPGAEPVGLEEELRRVLPVLEALAPLKARISVDTYRSETARQALALGAGMINDITAGRQEPEIAGVVADVGCLYTIMHMQGMPRTMQRNPRYSDIVDDICRFFEERLAALTREGVREEQIWLDPGFGFGKTLNHNLEMLRRLDEYRRFGRPILIGVSNKSTIGKVLDTAVDDRMEGTAAAVAVAAWQGAHCVRVHDVRRMVRIVRMIEAIKRGT